MLRSTWAATDTRTGSRQRTARRTWCERVSFGGVVFELLGSDALAHDLAGAEQRFWQRGADPRAIADVACAVRVEAGEAFAAADNAIRGAIDPGTGRGVVHARSLHAEIAAVGARHYAVDARIGREPEALVGLLRALTAAIVQREGGLMLHCAAIELDGEALLLVGPSGAGKSTAARLADGARCFAYDHVALVPSAGRWLAWGLPGGTPAGAPLARGIVYPVAAVLRVRKSEPSHAPRAQRLRGVQALFAVRESVECAEASAGAEDAYLHAVTKLSAQIAVGTLHSVLDRPHGAVLRAFLREQAGRKKARS